eukprot:IDg20746t1
MACDCMLSLLLAHRKCMSRIDMCAKTAPDCLLRERQLRPFFYDGRLLCFDVHPMHVFRSILAAVVQLELRKKHFTMP